MKSNRPYENTYTNRVTQFELDEKKLSVQSQLPPKSKAKKAPPVDEKNPYLQARLKVLAGYEAWRRTEVEKLERTGDIDNRFYNQFIVAVLTLLGEEPSTELKSKC